MKKVCIGQMQFTPYRPWSEERKASARARISLRRDTPMVREKTKAELRTMLEEAMRNTFAKKPPEPPAAQDVVAPQLEEWQPRIRNAIWPTPYNKGLMVRLHDDCFELKGPLVINSFAWHDKLYRLDVPARFVAHFYYADIEPTKVTIGSMDGDFAETAVAKLVRPPGQ